MGAIVITGLGLVSALGTGVDAHRTALWSGASGIRQVRRFETGALATGLGALWSGWEDRAQPESGRNRDLFETARAFPLHELALIAAREAWSSSGAVAPPRRVALVFGTCFGQGFREFDPVTRRIGAGLDVAGPMVTVSTACASSTTAIGMARDLLARGHADVVIAGGADSLLREAQAGFSALGVLSTSPAAPFSEPQGTTLGEGAAFFVLEREEEAARRSATVWASIEGYGLSADGHHETTPHPDGAGVARALRAAIEDAGWEPNDVDFVSAHATGTANNDRIEWSVIARELGASGRLPAVCGSKGHVGHTQGASGALELALALICHREGCVPPTLHFRGPRTGCPSDPVAQPTPRRGSARRALKLSAAFGGANSVLAYACGAPSKPRAAPRARRSIVLRGVGLVGPTGSGRIGRVLELTSHRAVGPALDVDLDALGVDARRLDRSARWLTAAAALALAEQDARSLARIGIFVAASRMPEESAARCVASIRNRGVAGTSANAFARMSVNAPTGACTVALGLLGPTNTLSTGVGSGLAALLFAADWLAHRGEAASLLAAAVDERSGDPRETAEGAAALLLTATDTTGDDVVVAGWAIAGPDDGIEAAEKALGDRDRADVIVVDGPDAVRRDLIPKLAPGRAIGLIDGQKLWGEADASRSGVMAAVAAAHVERGDAERALVLSTRGSASVAVVFERGGSR